MTQLIRWDPWRELEDMHNRLSSFFSEKPARRGNGSETMTFADWSPVVDISEDDKAYIIKAELPEGFQSSEFNLEHGFIDRVVDREDLRETLIRILNYVAPGAHFDAPLAEN